MCVSLFFFSSRRRHTRYWRDWSSDVCSSDLKQLATFREKLGASRALPRATLELLRAAAAEGAPAMDALRMAASTTSLGMIDDPFAGALALVARLPGIVAAYSRLLVGEEPVAQRSEEHT